MMDLHPLTAFMEAPDLIRSGTNLEVHAPLNTNGLHADELLDWINRFLAPGSCTDLTAILQTFEVGGVSREAICSRVEDKV
jgi:hypothetical protein